MTIESVMLPNHCILYHRFLLLSSIFPSLRVFSNELVLCNTWPKYWSFSISNSPSNEYSGLISFRIDWFDLLVVQGTLKSLLQLHSSKASVHQCSTLKFSPVTQSCLTLCDSMDCSTPGFPVHHQLPELTQTHAR